MSEKAVRGQLWHVGSMRKVIKQIIAYFIVCLLHLFSWFLNRMVVRRKLWLSALKAWQGTSNQDCNAYLIVWFSRNGMIAWRRRFFHVFRNFQWTRGIRFRTIWNVWTCEAPTLPRRSSSILMKTTSRAAPVDSQFGRVRSIQVGIVTVVCSSFLQVLARHCGQELWLPCRAWEAALCRGSESPAYLICHCYFFCREDTMRMWFCWWQRVHLAWHSCFCPSTSNSLLCDTCTIPFTVPPFHIIRKQLASLPILNDKTFENTRTNRWVWNIDGLHCFQGWRWTKLFHLLQVMKFQQKQQPGLEHRGGCQRANTHTKLMAFRLLSGEAVGCEAEIGKLGKKDW